MGAGGKSALEVAQEYGHSEIAQLLSAEWNTEEHQMFPPAFRRLAVGLVLSLRVRGLSCQVYEIILSCWNRAEVFTEPVVC